MRILPVLAVLALVSPDAYAPTAYANDGFGGLTATGLTFGQTDAIAMEEEDLFISREKVTVDYVFRNLTDADVRGEVIFPLPPVSLSQVMMSGYNLPEDRDRDNLVNFRAVVDGQEVPLGIDRIAVIEPAWEEDRPLAQAYDTPGKDVTALLNRFDIPLTVNDEAVRQALMALPPSGLAEMVQAGLLEAYVPGQVATVDDVMPLWSVVLRYHWTQTFPAGQTLQVSHSYDNFPSGGVFSWQDPPTEDWLQDPKQRYCIDDATSRGIAKRLAASEYDGMVTGMAWNLSYVLRTANSWAGPIDRFRLTIDKGDAGHILSLCADGITKTGPTTFVLEKRDFTPMDDLQILIVAPMEG